MNSPITIAKLALAVAGIAVWWYGNRTNQPTLGYIGIGLLALAVVLRFIARGRRAREED
jgi:hypothetical protein